MHLSVVQALTNADADINVVTQTLHSNYYGTLQATRELLPLVRKGGRLVNVASIAGHLNDKYSPAICQRFAATQSVDDVDRLMQDFTNAVKEGVHRDQGWPNSAYSVSKSGVIGMTRAIASEEEKQGSGVLVNSCCPGWVKTDMTKYQATLTVDEGAKTPVLLALEDLGGTAGQFWTNERVSDDLDLGDKDFFADAQQLDYEMVSSISNAHGLDTSPCAVRKWAAISALQKRPGPML